MANINLLPWRAERRKKRQQEFYGVIGFVGLVAGFLIFSVNGYYAEAIDNQNRRNSFIMNETKVLDAKIAEISALRETRQKLIERMELTQALQGNRPIIVRVFDELARAVPDDLTFTSVSISGSNVKIKGVAKTMSRVSSLIRNLDQSDWFSGSNVLTVVEKSKGLYEFEVITNQVQPKAAED